MLKVLFLFFLYLTVLHIITENELEKLSNKQLRAQMLAEEQTPDLIKVLRKLVIKNHVLVFNVG